MCWIDPQAHTCVYLLNLIPSIFRVAPESCSLLFGNYVPRIKPRTENTIYWDGDKKRSQLVRSNILGDGASTSISFEDSDPSSLCDSNRFCSLLGLRTFEQPSLTLKIDGKEANSGFFCFTKRISSLNLNRADRIRRMSTNSYTTNICFGRLSTSRCCRMYID